MLPLDQPLYAVLDGARDRRIRGWIKDTRAPGWCLYRGDLLAALENAAPWLQVGAFFGPISVMVAEAKDRGAAHLFRPTRAGLDARLTELHDRAPSWHPCPPATIPS